jgi:hypothetical protein
MSMDETDRPQTPLEMLFILSAAAGEKIPLDTVAPKFSGRFNKGVDYSGDAAAFAREFDEDLAVLSFAAREFGLSPRLKLSVHSGSDKFALYGPIRRSLRRHGAGLHLKTAGTTWLEEVIGLAESGGEGLALARAVYRGAFDRFEEMCRPYAAVIEIDRARLPTPETVEGWDGARFAAALRHDASDLRYNPHLRQLVHVGYRVAAELGERYRAGLDACRPVIARNVADNLFARHLKPLFLDPEAGGAGGRSAEEAAAGPRPPGAPAARPEVSCRG